MCLSV